MENEQNQAHVLNWILGPRISLIHRAIFPSMYSIHTQWQAHRKAATQEYSDGVQMFSGPQRRQKHCGLARVRRMLLGSPSLKHRTTTPKGLRKEDITITTVSSIP